MQSAALRRPPSAQISTRSRMPASVRAWCASTTPISQGSPARRSACWRAAPVPPSYPDIVMTSAPALAMPMAIVPMPGTTGTFTMTLAWGFEVFSSSMSWARSSIE